jgi:uncharacterized protein with HXXEE motif
MGRAGPPMRPAAIYWLFPLGFIFHDLEELVTMTDWIARHQIELERISSLGAVARRLVESVPASPVEVGVTIALELALLLAVTSFATRRPDSRIRSYMYSAVLGVFVVHALTHALQVLVFRGYVPGMISAVTIIPAVGIIVYRRLFTSGALTPRTALVATLAGAVVFLPVFAGLVAIARRIDRILY